MTFDEKISFMKLIRVPEGMRLMMLPFNAQLVVDSTTSNIEARSVLTLEKMETRFEIMSEVESLVKRLAGLLFAAENEHLFRDVDSADQTLG